jgi:TolA-binding protein
VSDLAEFLQSRGARLGLKIAGVVVALGLLGTAGWLWLRAEETRGQAALAGAAEAVQQGDGPLATAEGRQKAIGLLQAVLTQHGRSAAAAQAAYQLGNLQYQAGDYAAARGLGPKQFFFEEALLDLARAQALAGKPAEARATYERVLKEAPETRRAEDIRGRIAALDPAAK